MLKQSIAKAGPKNIELGHVQKLEAEVDILADDAKRNLGIRR